jgi:hypothetical protein
VLAYCIKFCEQVRCDKFLYYGMEVVVSSFYLLVVSFLMHFINFCAWICYDHYLVLFPSLLWNVFCAPYLFHFPVAYDHYRFAFAMSCFCSGALVGSLGL